VYALQASNGNLLWEHRLLDATYQYAPQASGGVIYLGKDDYTIDTYSGSDGHPLWGYRSSTPLRWHPLIDNGLMFVRPLDGSLVVLRLSDGELLWRYAVNG
jgi:outer membrane protein assembly factor BamB